MDIIKFIDMEYLYGWRCNLKNYIVTLKTKGPVFIGSGEIKNKRQYIYDMNKSEVCIIDENKFLTWLVKKRLLSEYEKNFLYTKENKNLYEWLKRVAPMQRIEDFSVYKLSAKSLGKDEKKRLNDIQTFVKDAYGMPYIPGSSLKGAIRNILFSYKMKNTQNRTFQEYLNSEDKVYRIKNLEKMANKIDKKAFEFEIDEKNKDSYMKYISISDSEPIDIENLIFARKIDRRTDGKEKLLPVYREAIKPEVEIKFTLNIDERFPYNIEDIKEAIKEFESVVYEKFIRNFKISKKEDLKIYIGGGVGYQSKTSVYNLIKDNKISTKIVSRILDDKFNYKKRNNDTKNIHEDDWKKGVSPRVIKLTNYNNRKFEMGLCSIKFEEIK